MAQALANAWLFPLLLFGWFAMTVVLGFVSGWYSLMRTFPDRPEVPLLKLSTLSGTMGQGVRLAGMLRLSACPSGLRVGILRIFGVFSREFFVPWEVIRVTKQSYLWGEFADLHFGDVGHLCIPRTLANRLAAVVPDRWPERMPLPTEDSKKVAKVYLLGWLAITLIFGIFVTVVPRLDLRGQPPPVAVPILLVAANTGLFALLAYWLHRRGIK